jgi:hypothetical protein
MRPRRRIGLNIQQRITQQVPVSLQKTNRQRFLLGFVARLPQITHAGVGKTVGRRLAVSLTHSGRHAWLPGTAQPCEATIIGLVQFHQFDPELDLTFFQ